MPIAAVTLDAAGTLISPARPVAETYGVLAAEHGAALDHAALRQAFRAAFKSMPPMAFPGADPDALDRLERDWWRRLVRTVTDAAGGVTDFDAYFDALYAHYASAAAWHLYAEVGEVLSALGAAQVPMVVVSNFDSRLPGILAGHGIDHHFQRVIYSTAAGAAKPQTGIFTQALHSLGLPAAGVLHVGDSREADLHGAQAAGMAALLLRRNPDAVLDPLCEAHDLRAVLERINGRSSNT